MICHVARRPAMRAVLAVIACALIGATAIDVALAQSPFGVGHAPAPQASGFGGVTGFVLAKQAEFYRALGGMIRAAKADGTAVYGLLGLSFAYGIFHAAGPGHGKAVISSYLVANDETWRRGVTLSFASALMQALVAIAIVAVAAALLGATAKMMGNAVWAIETASYLLIVAVGGRLVWVKGRAFLAALRDARAAPALVPVGAAVSPGGAAADHHDHGHDAHHHDHTHDHHHHDHTHGDGHEVDSGHVHDEHCGHSHGPEPGTLAGPGGWRRGFSAILAVGLRPCSGAILVLVFALAQGLFWAGIAATFVMGLGTAITVAVIATFAVGAKGLAVRLARSNRSGYAAVMLRGLEVAAAGLVVCFGVLLLLGYMTTERMFAV